MLLNVGACPSQRVCECYIVCSLNQTLIFFSTFQLEAEEISLRRDQVPKKITCDTELRAFDAAGIEHTFTPEFHVRLSYCTKAMS